MEQRVGISGPLMFAALVGPRGKIMAFEPNPANRNRLEMHVARNPSLASRIKVWPLALSEQKGTAVFRSSDLVETGQSSGSHLASALPPEKEVVYAEFKMVQVETTSIDALIASGEVPVPVMMKIDVEGAEHVVLQGGRNFFQAHRPFLLIEVHHILQPCKDSCLG